MPTYKLPAEKKHKKDTEAMALNSVHMDDWDRRVTLPVNKEILDALQVGEIAEVRLRGEVIEARNNESQEHTSRTITLKVSEVSAYGDDDAHEREEEGMSAGYKRG